MGGAADEAVLNKVLKKPKNYIHNCFEAETVSPQSRTGSGFRSRYRSVSNDMSVLRSRCGHLYVIQGTEMCCTYTICAANFSFAQLAKRKSLGRSKPATNSQAKALATHCVEYSTISKPY